MSLWRLKTRRGLPALRLGLDSQQLAWLGDGHPALKSVATGNHRDGVAQALANAKPGTTVDIVAANDVALHWLQTPPAALASFDELRLVASTRCAHLFGGSPQDWWVAGDWNANQAFPCAGLPRSLVVPLTQQLEQLGVRVRWHTVWGLLCSAAADAFPSDGWSAISSPSRVVLWHCSAGQVNCLTQLPLNSQADEQHTAERVLQQTQVEAARSGEVKTGVVHWLNLASREEMSRVPGIKAISMSMPVSTPIPDSEAAMALSLGYLLEGGRQ